MTMKSAPKFTSLLVVCLGVFGVLKLLGVYFFFSGAEAQLPASPIPAPLIADDNQRAASQSSPAIAPGEVERRILERLAARRAALEEREQEIALRASVIAAAEAKLEDRFAAFERERAEIAALREEREAASTEEIEALVSAYEKMKARDAAAIFNDLDDDIMLTVASRMRTQALAGVLSEMAPAKARSLTVMLADRGSDIASTLEPTAE